MASSQSTVDFIVEQIEAAGNVSSKKMFGEYGIFCDDKMVAMVCDNQFLLKPTVGGREFIGAVVEASPYPGAKPYILIAGDLWEDREWPTRLVRVTSAELAIPKKKSRAAKKPA